MLPPKDLRPVLPHDSVLSRDAVRQLLEEGVLCTEQHRTKILAGLQK